MRIDQLLTELEPIREQIAKLPENLRGPAADEIASLVAARLLQQAINGKSAMEQVFELQDVTDEDWPQDGPVKVLD